MRARRAVRASGPFPETPIVLCTWRRLDRLGEVLRSIATQEGVRPPIVRVWNNNYDERDRVDAVVARLAGLQVDVHHSRENVGGIGRFRLARELPGQFPRVVFIDDDQTFADRWGLASMLHESSSRTVRSQWSFRFVAGGGFFDRVRCDPGEPAHYCGTGGMIVDTTLFDTPELFACPQRYTFVEDLWLSFVASHLLGWETLALATPMDTLDDGLDQFRSLRGVKSEFLGYLREERGWRV